MHRASGANNAFRAYVGGGSRSTIDKMDDTKAMQEMGGNMMANEKRKGVEAPQNYGFSSVNMSADKGSDGKITSGAESVIHYMGGNRSFPVAGPTDDRRHRMKDLEEGDSAMFRTNTDYQQFHMSKDGGFWSAPQDKTVRLALVDQQSGQQQQQSGGGQGGGGQSKDAGGGGGGGSGGSGQGQKSGKTLGQQAVKKDNQQSKRFMHLTKDEAASSGTNVRHYLDDGNGYYEVNSDKNVYVGALKGKGQLAKVVTVKGPCTNVLGKIG